MFRLVHPEARALATEAVRAAPEGYVVRVSEPTRSLEQNSAQWPILQAFADQLEWPVNGRMTKLSPDDWKDILTAAFGREQRIAEGLGGGYVFLGMRTRELSKERFSEWIDFLKATAVERGVEI
jgi:hypothetical protein